MFFKTDKTAIGRMCCRWGLDRAVRGWAQSRGWGLKDWPLWGKTADNEKFGCFWLKTFLLYQSFSVGSKIERLQLYWPCFVDNQFGNDTWRALGPNGSDKSSNCDHGIIQNICLNITFRVKRKGWLIIRLKTF